MQGDFRGNCKGLSSGKCLDIRPPTFVSDLFLILLAIFDYLVVQVVSQTQSCLRSYSHLKNAFSIVLQGANDPL